MALKSAKGIDHNEKVIAIRIQEIDDRNIRPDEIDIVDDGLCADSIGDIPLVGDFIGLRVSVYNNSNESFDRKGKMFKIVSRFFSLSSMIDDMKYPIICNLVVIAASNEEINRVNKD